MVKDNGGAAFPSPGVMINDGRGGEYQQGAYEGMTLRDHFASTAPVTVEDAMLVCLIDANAFGVLSIDQRRKVMITLAAMRYQYADFMLVERAL